MNPAECHWTCQQSKLEHLPNNIFSNKEIRDKLFTRRRNEMGTDCDCHILLDRTRPPHSYLNLPMDYDYRFEEQVNLNLSIAKIAVNVYQRGEYITFSC
ncbi:hypothetical protein NQ314_017276 [Rhamnusium bicolor]|uniref:Uncharacterized protein n=1 Tax=Rhamnusium bicolor TaxID=1586634 RepID=A0AAV8WTR2_9CUCU|nr:hypothetical protein NQ314_017276 [Rhamnusium bicolor]